MIYQQAGKRTTPYGPNIRYTVRFHVYALITDSLGGATPVDRYIEYRVVTPLGESHAVASAAIDFAKVHIGSLFREVDVTNVEHTFSYNEHDDLCTWESTGE